MASSRVKWSGAVVVNPKTKENNARNVLWVEIVRPKMSKDIRGNRESIQLIHEWLRSVVVESNQSKSSSPSQPPMSSMLSSSSPNNAPATRHHQHQQQQGQHQHGNRFHPNGLIVQGPSGVWKSLAVTLIGEEHGYEIVHTHCNVKRTPLNLEAVARQAFLSGKKTMLILDEFESFARETSSIKWVLKLLNLRTLVVVMICNTVKSCFSRIFQSCMVVNFRHYTSAETYSSLSGLDSYVPAMDRFLVAGMSNGNICQTINQIQFLYMGNTWLSSTTKKARKHKTWRKRNREERNRNQILKKQSPNPLKLWQTSNKLSSMDCLSQGNNLDFVSSMTTTTMTEDTVTTLWNTLHRDYIKYFNNDNESSSSYDKSLKSLRDMALCAEELSLGAWSCGNEELDADRQMLDEDSCRWSLGKLKTIGSLHKCMSVLRPKLRCQSVGRVGDIGREVKKKKRRSPKKLARMRYPY